MRRRKVSAMALLPLVLLIVSQIANSTDNNQRSHRTGRQRAFNEELQINVYPPELSVAEGRKASFECRARATDNSHYPEVRWTRVGGRLPDGVHEGGGTLTIPQAQRHHSGQYACVAMHNGRTVEAYATLHVKPYGPAEEMGGDPTIIAAGCMADERACGNNECVKLEYVCDGEPDCRDRSDELNCPAKRNCEPNEFRCRNDKCVQKMWLCDGDDDCGDKSDEQNCGQRQPGDMCQPTEFRCTNGRQCVPQSFQCDGTNDCQDGSDEIGCVQPTVVQAPESNKVVQQGQDFKLTCRAVGVPDPYINWRLNWADVCEPPRCQQVSQGGVGTLSVQNAQPMDQGAYTCEAINVKGRVLATPDCIVRIVSIPAPQAPQPPPPPPPEPQRLTCNAQGAYSPYTDTRGQCQCKPLTTGTTCSQCVQGAYHLSDRAPQGCLKCFCFGVTDRCHSSGLYRTKDIACEKLFFAGDSQGIELSNVQGQAQPGIQFDFEQYGFLTHKEPHFSQTLYWKLPQRFLGDKVTAYGGDLSVQLQYQGAGQIREEPLVVIQGNGVTLVHKPRDQESQFTPGHPFAVSVNTYEQNYEHQNGSPASREDLMMALADLNLVLIRATHTDDQSSSSLGDTSWEIAVPRDTQEERALEVEQCECPPGYTGTSCEDCAEGYERSGHGPYLGYCVPARQPPARPLCDSAGALSAHPQHDGNCDCKQNVVGVTCDRCAPESFNLAPQNPQGCLRCFCSGVTRACESSHWRRNRIELDYARGDRDQLDATTSDARSPYKPPTQPQVHDGSINFNGFYEARGQTLYWSLPQKFLGDKVTAYGGKLRYTFRFSGSGSLNADADVIIRGNNIQLQYSNRQQVHADRDNYVEIPITELGWRHSNGVSASREQLMMVLADLDGLLIKMSYMRECSQASLVSVSLDNADAYGAGETASEVEQCQCPSGYIGTSCEDCAPGYSRTGGGPYLGACEKCECYNHASECDAEYGACIDCQHNTEGDRCERCKPGFVGDASRGTPYDCRPAPEAAVTRPRCECHNHSPRGCDSYGRCILCEHNTEGFHCELCKKGFYGNSTKGTPWDCSQCPCPGAAECFLDARGQVQCRNCPPGFAGRLCNECAPGYTPGQTADGRKCEPIGKHKPSEVEFVPEPDEGLLTSSTTEEPPPGTTEPGLQLGGYVDIEVERGEPGERVIGVVGPDRLLPPEGRKGTTIPDELDEKLSNGEGIGEEDSVEEDNLGDRPAESAQFRQFSGATALALPSERALRLDALNLELQIRPQSPNGIIFFASAAAPRRQKYERLFIHSLEVQNGLVQYKFSPTGHPFEIAQSSDKVPLNELTNVRVLNDGRGKVTLQIGSARPTELVYSSDHIAYPSNAPSRVFIGGMDPKRAKHFPKMINFIGSIGHLKINGKSVELDGDGRAESVEGYPIGGTDRDQQESSLDQDENQCSSEPCRNGGRCQLTRWGFECHCSEGYAGNLCQLPSTDGICPGGQHLCAHGVCALAEDSRGVQCLCPPGREGMRCESETDLLKEAKGIHFDGKHSFLALPLGAGVEEGGQIVPRPYSIELRLSPERRPSESRQQLIGAMVGARGEVISAIGMQEEKFWMVHSEGDNQPSTKRFLTKRIKHINTHHLRIEPGDTLNEMNVLVEGRPKGVLKGEAGADGILLLGGMPPRGIAMPEAIQSTLKDVVPFEGCVEELLLNGRVLSMAELKRDGYTGANLQSCGMKTTTTTPVPTSYQAEAEEEPFPTELDTFSTSTLLPPTAPPTIFTVSEDPNLATQRNREGPLVGTVGTMEVEYDEAESRRHPATTTAFPEEMAFKGRPASFGTTVETSETLMFTTVSPTPEPTTIVPAPPRPSDQRRRPDSITQMPKSPYPPPTPNAPNMPSTIAPRPAESAEIEGPFVGLCEESTCGAHGHCEEVNGTHVLCECRDYYVGQFCEAFRPIEYAAKFDGSAFVVFSSDEFPHLSSEQEESVEFKVRTRAKYGLIIWQGQQPSLPDEATPDDLLLGEDFLSIGILDGHLSFSFELGGGAAQILSERPVDDGKTHSIKAIRRGRDGWLTVDNGMPMIGRSSGILAMLNVEGHVFVGGVPDLHEMTAGLHTQNFVGCLAELALNGQKMDLMHSAIDGRNLRPCRSWQPNRMRRRRKWMRRVRKQRKAAEHRRAALGG